MKIKELLALKVFSFTLSIQLSLKGIRRPGK